MKKYLLTILAATFLFGCMEDGSDQKLGAQQENLMNEATRQVGMPAIVNFQERKLLKQILELRDQEHLICYAYIMPEMTGKLVFIGKCLGYGIPYATQYTNPQKQVYPGYHDGSILPQADPNGLFMPDNAEGTWLMLLDKQGNPHPVYIEPRVIVSPFPLENN
jgi:hypothetical protein